MLLVAGHAPVGIFATFVMALGPPMNVVQTAYHLCCLVVAASLFGIGRGFRAAVRYMVVTKTMHTYCIALRFSCEA